MGLHISVYRSAEFSDASNGGISSKYSKLTVVNCSGPFEPTLDAPAVWLKQHATMKNVAFIVPCSVTAQGRYIPTGRHTMFGGNYGSTSDSRFGEKMEELTGYRWHGAVQIHDRIE